MVGSSFEKLAQRSMLKVLQRGEVRDLRGAQSIPVKNDVVAVCLNSMRFTAIMFFVYPRRREVLSFFLGEAVATEVLSTIPQQTPISELLSDRYSEIANMVVGRMRQDMSEAFRFTGQSTPMMLNVSDAPSHIDGLSASMKIALGVFDGEGLVMALHSAIHCSDVKTLSFPLVSDVPADAAVQSEADAGSLEFL
jgi:hypothetical protein